MLNAVLNVAHFPDGRAPDLTEQAKEPMQAGVETSNAPEDLIETLESMPGHVDPFAAVFPGVEEPITFDGFAPATELSEAVLITRSDSFDQWLQGADGTMSEQEKRGLRILMDTCCVSCQSGVNSGGQTIIPST